MATYHHEVFIDDRTSKRDLAKRLEDSSWGFFLLMIGTLLLLPGELVDNFRVHPCTSYVRNTRRESLRDWNEACWASPWN